MWAYHRLRPQTAEESVKIALRLYPHLEAVAGNLARVYSFATGVVQKGWRKDAELLGLVRGAGLTPTEVVSSLR